MRGATYGRLILAPRDILLFEVIPTPLSHDGSRLAFRIDEYIVIRYIVGVRCASARSQEHPLDFDGERERAGTVAAGRLRRVRTRSQGTRGRGHYTRKGRIRMNPFKAIQYKEQVFSHLKGLDDISNDQIGEHINLT